MIFFLIVSILVIIIGLALLYFIHIGQKDLGVLGKHVISLDNGTNPGITLFADSIDLVGRPDYLIKEKGKVFPVEVKTGKTPSYPHQNHIMQLMAYCYLVEESYGRPTGGVIRYPEKEFKIAYTDEAKIMVQKLSHEIIENKKTNHEFRCNHPYHNI